MSSYLEAERLVLRGFTEDDVDRLHHLHNDVEVMRFLNGGRPTSRQTIVTETLPRFRHVHPCLDAPGFFAAEHAGAFVGWFEFRPLDENSSAVVELGYRLGRAAWGNGFAVEGARALLAKGFTDLGVERVTANTMAVNLRSRRVMEKVGLRYRRTYTQDWPDPLVGAEHGEVEYDIERANWSP